MVPSSTHAFIHLAARLVVQSMHMHATTCVFTEEGEVTHKYEARTNGLEHASTNLSSDSCSMLQQMMVSSCNKQTVMCMSVSGHQCTDAAHCDCHHQSIAMRKTLHW
jgi:hypothetical protein